MLRRVAGSALRTLAFGLTAYVVVGPSVPLGPTLPRWALLLADHERLYVLALALPVALVAAWWRDLALGALVAVPLGAWGVVLARDLVPRTPPPACGEPLRLVTANLLMVHPDPTALAAELAAADADVLVLQEYSSRWEAALASLRATYPYGVDRVRDDSFGTAIFARVPLEAEVFDLAGLPQTRARLRLGDRDIELWNIHTLPPRTPEYLAPYLEALDSVAAFMERAAAGGESFVVTGDLNATPTSRFAGRVRGWPWAPGPAADAWELVGGGFGFTWPNGVFPLPAARMDHVYLSHDLTIGTIEVGRGAGSDHRPLRVTIAPACPAP